MQSKSMWVWVVGLLVAAVLPLQAESGHRIGAGANYWTVIDDIDVSDIDDDGFSYNISYQYRLEGPFALDLTLEKLPDRFGEDVYAPQGYLLLGSVIYAGIGAGAIYTDGDFSDEPFYAIKAGVSLPFPFLELDLSAHYRFNDFADLDDEDRKIDTDTVFLGGSLRLAL